jgi:hypothetical protein
MARCSSRADTMPPLKRPPRRSTILRPARGARTGSMATVRRHHTTTLLPNGKVLAVGGYGGAASRTRARNSNDPTTGTWSATASLAQGPLLSHGHPLPNGTVARRGAV